MFAVIDIETTGGKPTKEKITEIAIFLHDGKKITGEFSTLINPEREIPYYIISLTGITNEMVAEAPRFYEVARQIVEMTEGKIFVAHNASFDYNFMVEEFRSLGFPFKRNTLCTVKSSRKLMPGYPSYSLGKLCSKLGITIENRHRAAGDAFATVKLLEHLIGIQKDFHLELAAEKKTHIKNMPPTLAPDCIDKLPEQPGLYYFLDEEGHLLYIGKSVNIRKRVIQHFSKNGSKNIHEMRARTADIQYKLTGNELIALLRESAEIKNKDPYYNRALRKKSRYYGISGYHDQKGYYRLAITPATDTSLKKFKTKMAARVFLEYLCDEEGLCSKLCGLEKGKGPCFNHSLQKCAGACSGVEDTDNYNRKVQGIFEDLPPFEKDFLIIEKGRHENEKSAILARNGKYRGFCYFNPEFIAENTELILDSIKKVPDDPDATAILKSYLKNIPASNIVDLKDF